MKHRSLLFTYMSCYFVILSKFLLLNEVSVFILGIGAIMFSIPKFMIGDYLPHESSSAINLTSYNFCSQNATSTILELGKHHCDEGTSQSSGLYLTILCIANMLMGIGATPLNTLGAAYLDENVSPKNSPLYVGIWYGMLILGPSVGFSTASGFLGQYTNIGEVINVFFVFFFLFCFTMI